MIIIGAEQQTETPTRNRTTRKDESDLLVSKAREAGDGLIYKGMGGNGREGGGGEQGEKREEGRRGFRYLGILG